MSDNKYWYKCECVGQILDKIIEVNKLENVAFICMEPFSLSGDLASTVAVEFEGKKKRKTYQLVHTYCPFCGKKILNKEGEQ